MQNASTMSPSMAPCLRTNRMPSFMLPRMLAVVFSGRKRMVSIISATTGAANDKVFSAKHHVAPSLARATPPKAGPIITAALNWMEFRAMALGISSLLTRVGMSAV